VKDDEDWIGVGEPEIVACPDGPLLLRGAFRLTDGDGRAIDTHRRTVALCRCGASDLKPFCDGSHKLTRFRTGPEPDQPEVSDP
jgi:CDGSH-type Zn-finger protein